jgi:hypothetical protein
MNIFFSFPCTKDMYYLILKICLWLNCINMVGIFMSAMFAVCMLHVYTHQQRKGVLTADIISAD